MTFFHYSEVPEISRSPQKLQWAHSRSGHSASKQIRTYKTENRQQNSACAHHNADVILNVLQTGSYHGVTPKESRCRMAGSSCRPKLLRPMRFEHQVAHVTWFGRLIGDPLKNLRRTIFDFFGSWDMTPSSVGSLRRNQCAMPTCSRDLHSLTLFFPQHHSASATSQPSAAKPDTLTNPHPSLFRPSRPHEII